MADVELTLGLQMAGVQNQLNVVTQEINKMADAGRKAGAGNQKMANDGEKSFARLSSAIKTTGAAYLSLRTAQAAFNSAKESAATRDAIAVLEAAGGSVEVLREQTRGLFSDAELAKNANLSRTLGIAGKDFAQLANIAGAAARATGEDANFLLESIARGTARGSKLLLDNLGILIDNNVVQAEANKLRKANAKLSADQAKQQAFVNEVLNQGAGIIAEVNAAGANSGEVFDKFEAAMGNAKNTLGDLLIPAMKAATTVATKLARALDEALGFQTKGEVQRQFTKDVTAQLEQELFDTQQQLARMGGRQAMGEQQDRLRKKIKNLNDKLSDLRAELETTDEGRKKTGGETEADRRKREREAKRREKEMLEGVGGDLFASVRVKGARAEEFAEDFLDGQNAILDAESERRQMAAEEAEQIRLQELDAEREAHAERVEMERMEAEQIRQNQEDERQAQLDIRADQEAHHRARMEELRELQAEAHNAIGIGVGLAQELTQLIIEQDEHIMERLTASALARVGNEFVARGSLLAAEGVGLAILSHGADPAAYAAIAQGGAMIATGIGMGAAGAAITQSISTSSAGRDTVADDSLAARGAGAQNIGSANAVNITVNYGVMGPNPDDTARAIVNAQALARRRGFNSATRVTP